MGFIYSDRAFLLVVLWVDFKKNSTIRWLHFRCRMGTTELSLLDGILDHYDCIQLRGALKEGVIRRLGMKDSEHKEIASQLLAKAYALGADLAGFASVDDLRTAPSFSFAPKMPGISGAVGTLKDTPGQRPGEVKWPGKAGTVMVVSIYHPQEKPELDWWLEQKDPPGNRLLAQIVKDLCEWAAECFGIDAVHLPYHVEKGGTYLKDAAVIAALGTVGRSNILVTPEFGPRVRLRALTLDLKLPSSGPVTFDPCRSCDDLCRKACPQDSFGQRIYSRYEFDQDILPGRDGMYSRPLCNLQMEMDNEAATRERVEGFDDPIEVVKYCRECEFSCPVGKP